MAEEPCMYNFDCQYFSTKMFLGSKAFSVFALFLIISIDRTSSECVKQSGCSCRFADGKGYDLSSLEKKDLMVVTSNSGAYTFAFHPCHNIPMDMNVTNSECNTGDGVSLCVREQNQTYNLGTIDDTTFEVKDGINSMTELVLKHKSNVTHILLVCCEDCPKTTLSITVEPEPAKKNLLMLSSKFACKIQMASTGLSTGSVLVILLFTFTGIYLILGALTMKFLRGATGLEMLPNYAFWSDFPSLVRDGIAFTFSGCKADSYDRI